MTNLTGLYWQNINANRKYPLRETDTLISLAGDTLPNDIVVDCRMWSIGNSSPYLGSIFVDSGYVGVAFVVGTQMVAGFSGQVRPYEVYPLESRVDGFSGFISFGTGVNNHKGNWSFDSTSARLVDSCVFRVPDIGGITFEDSRTGKQIDGNVEFVNGTTNKLKISVRKSTDTNPVVIDNNPVNAVVLSLNTDEGGNALLSEFLCPWEKSPDNDNCTKTVINSINSVTPDCDGVITLNLFDLNQDRTGVRIYPGKSPNSNMLLFGVSSNVGLNRVCDGKIKRYNESSININEDCLDPELLGNAEDNRCNPETDECGNPLDEL